MLEVTPGITALLKPKDETQKSTKSNLVLKNFDNYDTIQFKINLDQQICSWKLIEINQEAEIYHNIKSQDNLQQFLMSIDVQNSSQNLNDLIDNFIYENKNNETNNTKKFEIIGYYTKNKQQRKKVQVILIQFQWSGKPNYLLRIVDISQEEEITQLKQLDQFKDKVLATISHDLRTPLNTILYSLNLLSDLVDQPLKKILKQIKLAKTNANLLLSLIEDILDSAQMKNSQINLSITSFSISTFLQEIEDIISIQAKLKNLHFSIINSLGDLTIVNDQRRLKQILINFLTNAIKFTSAGSVTLQIKYSVLGHLYFEVNDTGSGIPPERIAKLGSAYATYGTDTNQNSTGIGLGLHLSKQLIGKLGPEEKFQVQSEVGKGTKFSFEIFQNFLLKDQEQQLEQEIESSCEVCEVALNDEFEKLSFDEPIGGLFQLQTLTQLNKNENALELNTTRILIVDDNVFNIFVLKAQLKKIVKNLEIIQCYNGLEAVNNFESYNKSKDSAFQLIFMDCDMPVMNGYQATREIIKKIQFGGFLDCKIIGNSALVTKNEEKKCLACGMDIVISKPIEQRILEKLVKSFNQRYQQF